MKDMATFNFLEKDSVACLPHKGFRGRKPRGEGLATKNQGVPGVGAAAQALPAPHQDPSAPGAAQPAT